MERSIKRLEKITNTIGVAGDEMKVRNVIKEYISPHVESMEVDPLGNLIVKVCSSPQASKNLLLDAHMDEIGFMVSDIMKDGFLRFIPIGGFDPRILLAQSVTLQTSKGELFDGVIGSKPPHIQTVEERKAVVPFEDLFVDIGFSSASEVTENGIQIGDRMILSQNFSFLRENSDIMKGRAFDDRIGCAVIVEVIEQIKEKGKPEHGTIWAGFSVQEEVGIRGAGPLAYTVNPQCAMAIEGTVAADTPGTKPGTNPSIMGKGPAITLMDRSLLADRRVVRKFKEIAKTNDIPIQFKRPVLVGGTNAGEIHRIRGGILSGVLSVPVRYIHSPNQLASHNDFQNTIKLTTEFCYSFHELF